jgi:hypothetical protein
VTSADFQASDCSAYNVCTTTGWKCQGRKVVSEPLRVGAASASGSLAPDVTAPALGAAEIEGGAFSPSPLAVGLKELPSFVALSEPANASVEQAIRPTLSQSRIFAIPVEDHATRSIVTRDRVVISIFKKTIQAQHIHSG